MRIKLALLTLAALCLPRTGFSGTYFSAHFCQPYKNGATPAIESYYQNQGSVLAAAADAPLHCPISFTTLNPIARVRVYYATQGVSAAQPIWCRLWKISSANETAPGAPRTGLPNQSASAFDVSSLDTPANVVGANLECRLKPGAKILGYYLY